MIKIKPDTKRNAYTLTFGSIIALMLLLAAMLTWPAYSLNLLLLFLAAFIAVILGVAKILEPETSLELDQTGLTFFHVKGHFHLAWQDIQRFDIPTVGAREPLHYLGIKLRHPEALLNSISPRLTSHFIVEQRALLVLAMRYNSDCPSCASEHMFDVRDYLSPNKTRYTGLNAMLGHRMALLNELLGYHIYISASSLDRPLEDFLPLIREMHQQHLHP
ncbi:MULTISPECIES: DUF2982 domain-containing protein [unclassified Motilimonas]|uniref:DUF2982 domain-containing protein n=1 Tax=unclassified Motilimonas TaxID=2643697 RepID=UPI001E2CD1DF|nr:MULTISPECIES: DUF2982 domain-containing protein [unclassified Motilimonas]MCE0555363.1 DUF2982 domain-containing protein [Motilimonas sp. E26]MDO6527137.1 DUF2982 domain-containing protein [Motilimonas sp. 1_MG-2023]